MVDAMYVLAVDPGDIFVGLASWTRYAGRSRWESWQVHADEAADTVDQRLASHIQIPRELVIEEFRLYPNRAAAQSWSPMDTAQLIGALRNDARRAAVPVAMQGADIQKPMEAQLKARGVELNPTGPHARSAQLHLWHRLLKREYIEERSIA